MPEGWLSFTWYDKLVKLYEISDEFRDGSVNNPRHFYTTCFQLSCRKSAPAFYTHARFRAGRQRNVKTNYQERWIAVIIRLEPVPVAWRWFTVSKWLLDPSPRSPCWRWQDIFWRQQRNYHVEVMSSRAVIVIRRPRRRWSLVIGLQLEKAFSSSNMFLILFNSMLR